MSGSTGCTWIAVFALGLGLGLGGCRLDSPEPTEPDPPVVDDPPPPQPEVLLAAANIASCGSDKDEATAALLDERPGTVVTLGDNAFRSGTLEEYQQCYAPSWGRHQARTYATLGNHEYYTGTAVGTFDYFAERAGPRDLGFYSFDLGEWHIIVLNSNHSYVPLTEGSPQDEWLVADLAANQRLCTMAIWHHGRFFSSTVNGPTSLARMRHVWNRLYEAGVDVVLNGQHHHYERFRPMTPDGAVDDSTGIREFNVGTGGESLAMPVGPAPNSEVIAAVYGVLELKLYPDRYEWTFLPIAGETFTDTGSGTCH